MKNKNLVGSIETEYKYLTKGQMYLTDDMKVALLWKAIGSVMISQSDADRQTPTKDLVEIFFHIACKHLPTMYGKE